MGDIRRGTVWPAHLHHNEINGHFQVSLDRLTIADERVLYPPIRWESSIDVAAGRNQVCEGFLTGDAEWLLFLDDDMGFGADLVDRLLSAASTARPVIAGLYFAQRSYVVTDEWAHRFVVRPQIYNWVPESNAYVIAEDYLRDAVVEVDATGAGVLLVHRAVLQALYDRIGANWFTPISLPNQGGDPTRLSEDLSFCHRLRAAGVPIHVNTAARTSHRKPVFLDEWFFEHQPAQLIEPKVAIVGTGRSGTFFISQALTATGVHCGHEKWWNPHGVRSPDLVGDASWIATNHLDDYSGKVWHQTRHPLAVIRSLVGNELFQSPDERPGWVVPYEEERRRWASYSLSDPAEVKALRVVAHWWATAEKHAERTWRLEDVTPGLLLELADELGQSTSLAKCRQVIDGLGTDANKHPDGPQLAWADLPEGDDKALIADMAESFGYRL